MEKDRVSLATLALAKAYTDEHGGGGGGGTDNYNDLTHLPTVNGVEFKGTMTGATLGLVNAENGKGLSANDYTDADKSIVGGVTSALSGKVDKVSGKGLSTNDYSDSDKAVVDGVTTALNGKVDKVSGKGLSTNDYSDADKTIVDGVTTALAGKVDKNGTDRLMTAAEGTKLNGLAEIKSVGSGLNLNSTTGELSSDISASVSIDTTGTASASSTRQQQLTIDGVATDIDGTKYMETTSYTTPSTGVRRFTFTGNAIQSTSVFDFYCDVFGVSPSAVTLDTTSSTHSLAVDFNASDNVGKCRVYIRG